MGALIGNPVRSVAPPTLPEATGAALELDAIRRLIEAAAGHRLGASVALLFLQGWRVSEVLGLAWDDLDLEAGTAKMLRASVYVGGRGQQLGPTKTEGAQGEHFLSPTVVALLRIHRQRQDQERAAAPWWTRPPTRERQSTSSLRPRPADSCCARPSPRSSSRRPRRRRHGIGQHPRRPPVGHHCAVGRRRRNSRRHRRLRRPRQHHDHGRLRQATRPPTEERRRPCCRAARQRRPGFGINTCAW